MHIFGYKEASGAQLALTLFLGDLLRVLDKATIILVVYADVPRWCLCQPIWARNRWRCAATPPFYRGNAGGVVGSPIISLSWRWERQEQPLVARALGACTPMLQHGRGNIWAQAEFFAYHERSPQPAGPCKSCRLLKETMLLSKMRQGFRGKKSSLIIWWVSHDGFLF